MPARAGDIYNLSSYKEAVQKFVKEIYDEQPKILPCKIPGVDSYSFSKKYFVLYKETKIISFIKYTKKSKTMFIEQVENLSSIKGISLQMYLFILKNKLFKDIETGDILSDKNVSAHKSMVGKTSPFKFYIRNLETKEDVLIVSAADIDQEMKKDDMSKVFVIKENFEMVKVLTSRLEQDGEKFINEMITRLSYETL